VSPECINSIGLVANILGVGLAFFFGYPQPNHDEGVSLGLEDGTVFADGTSVADINRQTAARKRKYMVWSRVGLSLMFLGFLLQLVATWA
jgi:hypothetical protein